eukprot:401733-Rhodomonas_salina.1
MQKPEMQKIFNIKIDEALFMWIKKGDCWERLENHENFENMLKSTQESLQQVMKATQELTGLQTR